MNATWSRALRIAFVVVVAAVFIRVAITDVDELRHVDFEITPGWLLLAAPGTFVASLLLPFAWRQLVAATGHVVSGRRALRIWCLSQTGRFVPTAAPAFASRAVLTAREGVPQPITLATMAVELALVVGVSTTVAAICLPSTTVVTWVRAATAIAGSAALIAGPFVLRWLSARVPRLDPHRTGGWSVRELYEAEMLVTANALAKSVAFVLLAAALVPVAGKDVLLLVGALNGGAVLGTIGITPAGLGVREGAIAGILSTRFGLGDAAALAVALRAWEIVFEGVWLAIVQHPTFRAPSDLLTAAEP
jgi:uncharacterized membrane protein YbhN (UPF0104 family)